MLYNIQKIGSLFFPLLVSVSRSYRNRNVPNELVKMEHKVVKFKLLRHFLGKIINKIDISKLIKCSFFFFKMSKNDNSQMVSTPTGRQHFVKEQFERKDICNTRMMKFENTVFRIPYNYDFYLTKLYGDYMVLPSKDHRERHLFLELRY